MEGRERKGTEGQMSVPWSLLLLPCEITLLPPPNPQLNLQTHDRNQPICIVELSVSMELKCLPHK